MPEHFELKSRIQCGWRSGPKLEWHRNQEVQFEIESRKQKSVLQKPEMKGIRHPSWIRTKVCNQEPGSRLTAEKGSECDLFASNLYFSDLLCCRLIGSRRVLRRGFIGPAGFVLEVTTGQLSPVWRSAHSAPPVILTPANRMCLFSLTGSARNVRKQKRPLREETRGWRNLHVICKSSVQKWSVPSAVCIYCP